MTAIINAAPMYILNGIQNNSGRRVDPEPEALPIHLAHVMFYAERGPSEALILTGGDARSIYGAKTFDYRDKYANHATALLQEALYKAGGVTMHQRLIPDDAKKSRVAVYLDLLEAVLPVYERNADGSYRKNAVTGELIDTGSTIPGYIGKWVVEAIPDNGVGARAIGAGTQRPGTQTDLVYGQSVQYPMFDLEVAHFGAYGDNVAFRLYAPTSKSGVPANAGLVGDLNAYVYRLQFLERANTLATPNVIRTRMDETFVEFGLKPGLFHEKTSRSYDADEVILPSYSERSPGVAPVYSPFGKFHVYQESVDAIQALVYEREEPFMNLPAGVDGTYQVNLLSAQTIDGVPYSTFTLLGVLDDGAKFDESSVYYARGGADGTMSDATFNAAVANEFNNYGALENKFLDELKFPASFVYDSGFDVDTKEALFTVLGKRKDIIVVAATQDVSQPQNTPTTDSSMAVALNTAAHFYPESALYGTSVCRAIIVGQSGYLINSAYKKLVPMTFEVAYKLSRYASASSGIVNERWAPDVSPNNKLELITGVNGTWKSAAVRNKDWATGLVWAQTYDTSSNFIPALQTAYDDDTSVINSVLTVMIASELQKVAMRVWRDMVGRNDLTKDQFIKLSNKLILEYGSATRFGNRVVIVPDTHFTVRDNQRGYSASAKINLYANNMTTVTSFTVVADRMEALNNG